MYKGRDDLISPEEAEKGVEIVSKICGVDKEKIHYIKDDVHTLVVGATRSGKSRYERMWCL